MTNVKHIVLWILIFLICGPLLAKGAENEVEGWAQKRRLFFVACLYYGYKSLGIERVDSSFEEEMNNLKDHRPMVKRVLAHTAEFVEGYMNECKASENEVPLKNVRLILYVCYGKYNDKNLKKLLQTPIKEEFIYKE